jgi:hypothetical protein
MANKLIRLLKRALMTNNFLLVSLGIWHLVRSLELKYSRVATT